MLQGHNLTQSQRRFKAITGSTKMFSIHTTRTIQKELERLQEQEILVPLKEDEMAKVVQYLHYSAKSQLNSIAVPEHSKDQSGTNKAKSQRAIIK